MFIFTYLRCLIYSFTHLRCLNILRAYPTVELDPLLRITVILFLIFCSWWLKCNSASEVANRLYVSYIV